MTDTFSVTANVFATVGFTAGLGHLLYTFFSSVRGAPQEIQQLASELEALSATFSRLEKIRRELPAPHGLRGGLLGDLYSCMVDFEDVEKRIRQSEKCLRQTLMKKSWARLKWPFRVSAATQIMKRIQSSHLTFSLALMTLQIQLGMKHEASLDSTRHLISSLNKATGVLSENLANVLQTPSQSPQVEMGCERSVEVCSDEAVNPPSNHQEMVNLIRDAIKDAIENSRSRYAARDDVGQSLDQRTAQFSEPSSSGHDSYVQPFSVTAATVHHREMRLVKLALWRGPLFVRRWHQAQKPAFGPLPRNRGYGFGISFAFPFSRFRVTFTTSFMRRMKQHLASPSVHCSISFPTVVAEDSEIIEFTSLGNLEALIRLFQSGKASPTDVTLQGSSLLHMAVKYNRLDICKLLLREGADVGAADEDGGTPLHVAISRTKNCDIVRLLMDHGADPGNCNANYETALHTFFNDTVHQVLLSYGEILDGDVRDSRGMTPLHFVAWSSKGTVDIVRRLVEHGSLTTALLKDNQGRSVLHFAAHRGNTAVVDYLLDLRAHVDVRCRDRRGRTVLHYAVECSRIEIINNLIKHGADVRAKDRKGRTVLHHASWRGNLEATKRVIELGAAEDLLSRDEDGMTPFDLAIGQAWTVVAVFLSSLTTGSECGQQSLIQRHLQSEQRRHKHRIPDYEAYQNRESFTGHGQIQRLGSALRKQPIFAIYTTEKFIWIGLIVVLFLSYVLVFIR